MSNKHPLVQAVEQSQLKTDVPSFGSGDTVVVQVKVREGDRERLQAFEGVVIAKRNRGLNSAFTVRKISSGVGVERVFQTHSPLIASIEVKRRGDVRRAKLYYLRERSGKSARIREKLSLRRDELVALDAASQDQLQAQGTVAGDTLLDAMVETAATQEAQIHNEQAQDQSVQDNGDNQA